MGEKKEVPVVFYDKDGKRKVIGDALVGLETGIAEMEIHDINIASLFKGVWKVMPGKDSDHRPLGNRTERPHSDKGWFPKREDETDSGKDFPPRGTVGYGEHDVPSKKD